MAGIGRFLSGVVAGGAVAGLTLVVASQLSAPRDVRPQVPLVDAPMAETVSGGVTNPLPVPPGPEAAAVDDDVPLADAVSLEPDAGVAGPEVPAPDSTALALPAPSAPPAIAEVPAEVPAVPPAVLLTDAPAQSAPDASDPAPVATAEAAGTLSAAAVAPLSPPIADGVPAGAEPPPPPPATAEEQAVLADPAQIILPAATDNVAVVPPVPEVPALPTPGPATVPTPVAPTEVADAALPEPLLPESPVIDVPDPAPVVIAEPVPAPLPEPLPAPDAPAIFAADAGPETLSPDVGLAVDGPTTLPATPSLITAGEGALTDRDSATGDAALADDVNALPEVALDSGPALERFAAPFANPDAKPLFGILLLDTGDATLDRQAVAALPFAVSIVIDPLSPDAATLAALYRAGGKEVVMLATGIPVGATPADLEQTFQAHAAALPEAVAVIDSADSAFQNDRPLSSQIVPILAAQGRGLLTWDRGLNAADQVAQREGLPAATVFRQIDAEGEGVPVMRRYLDRAAFKAAQEGRVIVIGTLRAETIAAILEWTIEGRASTVALAPASALLAAE